MILKVFPLLVLLTIVNGVPSCPCEETDEVAIFDDVDENVNVTSYGVTLPGTKWCGPGDNAKDISDLGTWSDLDSCCRAHDNCDDVLLKGETKHGLQNPDMFTRLHCKCEKEFRKCLKKLDSFTASAIGNTYTTARRYCFNYAHPIKKCIKFQEGWIMQRCIKYKLDKRQPKIWQWFDIPFY